jgi:hypothetical protein
MQEQIKAALLNKDIQTKISPFTYTSILEYSLKVNENAFSAIISSLFGISSEFQSKSKKPTANINPLPKKTRLDIFRAIFSHPETAAFLKQGLNRTLPEKCFILAIHENDEVLMDAILRNGGLNITHYVLLNHNNPEKKKIIEVMMNRPLAREKVDLKGLTEHQKKIIEQFITIHKS